MWYFIPEYLDILPHIDIFPRKSSRAVKPGSPNCSGDLHLYNDDDDDDNDDDENDDTDDDAYDSMTRLK